jgi:hypothetical protein
MTTRKSTINKKAIMLTTAAAALSLVLTSGMVVQQAFAHALNIQDLEVEGAGEREVTIVLGHTNEPTYGAKPGIHDGKHNVEVFLEDTETALPISGAELKVDKYYFKDFNAFKKAESLKDATEIEKGITLGGVFGDPGHYVARQVQKDGIYGYRLYGTIHYFGVAELVVDKTVFCRSPEGSTMKFNSPGWFGGYGCTEDIDDILFPEKNSDVNPSKTTGKASFEVSGAAVQQANNINSAAASGSTVAGFTSSESANALQMITMIGIPAAALAGVFGIKSLKQRNSHRS